MYRRDNRYKTSKDLFHFGLNRHIKSLFNKSLFPGGEFNGSLRGLMDYVLLYAGSSFTVGFAEEECDTASLTKTPDAPEGTHKMAEATTHHQFPESHHMPAKPGSALVVPARPESARVRPAKPGPARVMSATPESPAKMATTPADAPLWPGLIASVLDPPLVSVRAAGIPRSAALSAPSQELTESAPEAAPSQELAESAPEAAPSQELAESAPEAAPSQELAESTPEAAPSQELTESAPEAAPFQELTESGIPGPLLVPSGSPEPLLVPPGSPEALLVPPSSPSSPLVPPSSPSSPLVPSSLELSERPRDSVPPERPLEIVVFPKEIVLGGGTCLPTHRVPRSARAARVP